MSTISHLKKAVLLCREASDRDFSVTPFIWGDRGLGKSSLVKQLCQENNWGFIDMRCGQIEAADLRGLPTVGANRTVYLPPADMPLGDMSEDEIFERLNSIENKAEQYIELMKLQPHFPRGILFLDEINRAQDDVLQASFQLVLDRAIGQYQLPPGWSVVCAGNYMEGYSTNGFNDPAFLNRFCHLIMSSGESTAEEWVTFMANKYEGRATDVVECVMQDLSILDGKVEGSNLGFTIQPSRRGWEMVARVMLANLEIGMDPMIQTQVIQGIVGTEAATMFERFKLPVKPRQIINDGVKAHYATLTRMKRGQLLGLMWGLVSFCKSRIHEENIAKACLAYMKFLCESHKANRDIVVSMGRALLETGDDAQKNAVRAASITNLHLAKIISGHRQRKKGNKKTFLEYINNDQELAQLFSQTAWGDIDD